LEIRRRIGRSRTIKSPAPWLAAGTKLENPFHFSCGQFARKKKTVSPSIAEIFLKIAVKIYRAIA
jgi:hypothetical protein